MLYDNEKGYEVLDYLAEYRTVPELTLSGFRDEVSWSLEVAKVGGGTLGKTYPAGEQWIVNSFVDCILMESIVVKHSKAAKHIDVLKDFAEHWFNV